MGNVKYYVGIICKPGQKLIGAELLTAVSMNNTVSYA
jgi:hypothetical protein